MLRSLWSGASGMNSQQVNMDVVSNNLANVNNSGFNKSRAEFEDLLYANLEKPRQDIEGERSTPAGIQVGHGARVSSILKDFEQGSLEETNNKLDVAIEGNGFFVINNGEGEERYTRAGDFKLDGEGFIVTPDGRRLLDGPGGDEIDIDEEVTEIMIEADGTVNVEVEGDEDIEEVTQLQLAIFQNPAGLEATGENNYRATTASGEVQEGFPGEGGFGSLRQGFLESSNVNVAEEMVNMIKAQRAYEVNSQSVQTSDEMMGIANNLRT